MLLSITTTHAPATDLGFILQKSLGKVHNFPLPFGRATVFFPEANRQRCTVALWVERDPIGHPHPTEDLHRGLPERFVNDKAYAASSLLSAALNHVFHSAMIGQCSEFPFMTEMPIPLKVTLPVLRCQEGAPWLARLLEPLGYVLDVQPLDIMPLDREWGESPLFSMTLQHSIPLKKLLNHLYILLPAIDGRHDRIEEGEMENLTYYGQGWLDSHPQKLNIIQRYFRNRETLVSETLRRLEQNEDHAVTSGPVEVEPAPLTEAILENDHWPAYETALRRLVDQGPIETHVLGPVALKSGTCLKALEQPFPGLTEPCWVIFLPAQGPPPEFSLEEDFLEHPKDAFASFEKQGGQHLICQEIHKGGRAILVLCRTAPAAQRFFNAPDNQYGALYSRWAQRIFTDTALEQAFLHRLHSAFETCGFWEHFQTEWVCLDTTLLPWSFTAKTLLTQHHVSAARAASSEFSLVSALLALAQNRHLDVEDLQMHLETQRLRLNSFQAAYRKHCRPVKSVSDLRLAPFQILATSNGTHFDKNHLWHLEAIERMCEGDPELLLPTRHRLVDLESEVSRANAIAWWEELTVNGSEGMVVKPLDGIPKGRQGVLQPVIKVRGRQQLSLHYGLEYTVPENMARLRARNFSALRGLALLEFALGLEGLERFVHPEEGPSTLEFVSAILALEQEQARPGRGV